MEYPFQRKSLGITIVELMVAITVLALLTPVVLFTLGNYYEDNLNSVASSGQDADVRRALTTIQNDLRDTRGFRASLTVSNSPAPLGSTNGATGTGNWSYCGTNTTSLVCDGVTADNGTTNRVLIAYNDLTDGAAADESTKPVYIDNGQPLDLATAIPGTFAYIYFVAPDRNNPSQNNLYRRTIVQVDPSTADTYKSVSSGLSATPFQKTTCASTVVAANSSVCLERDAILLSNVKSFWVDYFDESNQKISGYYTNNATTASVAANSIKLNASTIKIRITKQMTTLSKRISQASGIINVNTISTSTSATASPRLVTTGLTINLDAGNTASYPGTGTTWTDLSGNGYNFTVNASAYSTTGGIPHMNFEGSFGAATRASDIPSYQNGTIFVCSTIKNSTADWRTLLRGASADHQVIIDGANNLGMYDNNGGGFLSSGFKITSLPNPYTQFNCLTFILSQSSPYYQFGYNGGTLTNSISNPNATFNNGFTIIGAYQGGGQFWGKIAVFLYYNRALTSSEITQNYNFYKTRFGI